MGINKRHQMIFLVKHLSPNTTYYFRIMPVNGCAPGQWSNEVSAKTRRFSSFTRYLTIKETTKTYQDTTKQTRDQSIKCQTYSVKKDDTLYSIAQRMFKNGARYKEIIEQNKDQYPSLKTSPNKIEIGWKLKINCQFEENKFEKKEKKP